MAGRRFESVRGGRDGKAVCSSLRCPRAMAAQRPQQQLHPEAPCSATLTNNNTYSPLQDWFEQSTPFRISESKPAESCGSHLAVLCSARINIAFCARLFSGALLSCIPVGCGHLESMQSPLRAPTTRRPMPAVMVAEPAGHPRE